jgi:hypothetical protein
MRSYGTKFLLELRDADPQLLGVQLGRAVVDANLPAIYVAKVLEVSKTTVYAWFRGQRVREDNRAKLEAFIKLLDEDTKAGSLPAKNIHDAKDYLANMVGRSL